MKQSFLIYFFGLSVLTACSLTTEKTVPITVVEKEVPSFYAALELHLASILSKNLKEYTNTLPNAPSRLSMIFPDGEILVQRDSIIKTHEEWFARDDWKFEYDIMKIDSSTEMSLALLDIDYERKDEAGETVVYQFYLSLIFKLVDSKWILIHDQNTIHS